MRRSIAPSAAAGRGSSSEPRRAPPTADCTKGQFRSSRRTPRLRGRRPSSPAATSREPTPPFPLPAVRRAPAGRSARRLLQPAAAARADREHGDDRHHRHRRSASSPPPAWSRPAPANRAFGCCRPATSPSMPGWRWRGGPSARSTSSTTTWPTTASACSSCASCATPPGAACASACSSTTSTPAARTSCSAASPRSPNVEVRLFNPLPSRGGSVLGRDRLPRRTSSAASTSGCTTSCSSPTTASRCPAAATWPTSTSCAAPRPTSSTWT